MILHNFFLDDFLVLKLFPGDPILDPPISGTPYEKRPRFPLFFFWGGLVFKGGQDECFIYFILSSYMKALPLLPGQARSLYPKIVNIYIYI